MKIRRRLNVPVRLLIDDRVYVQRPQNVRRALIIHNDDTIAAWCNEGVVVRRDRVFVTV